MKIPAPKPGVYRGVPDAEYHAWDCLSNSMLTIMDQSSPAHLRYQMEHPKPPTEDQIKGTAYHSAILQPGEFMLRYFRGEKFDKRTNEGKTKHAEQLQAAQGRIVLEAPDYDNVLAVRDAVLSNRKVARILENTPEVSRELSIVWTDKETGLLCKMRADLPCMHPLFGMLADLKSTANAARAAFAKSIYNFGYARQGVHYLEGLAAHDTFLPHFVLIAFEKEPPYPVALYRVDDESMRLAKMQRQRLMIQYAECLSTGRFPAYGDHIQDISLPAFAVREIEMETVTWQKN